MPDYKFYPEVSSFDIAYELFYIPLALLLYFPILVDMFVIESKDGQRKMLKGHGLYYSAYWSGTVLFSSLIPIIIGTIVYIAAYTFDIKSFSQVSIFGWYLYLIVFIYCHVYIFINLFIFQNGVIMMISSFVSILFSRRFAGLLSIMYLLFTIILPQTISTIEENSQWPFLLCLMPSLSLTRCLILLLLVYINLYVYIINRMDLMD